MKQKTTRPPFRLRNWPQYITALINRGSISIWLDTSSIDQWLNPLPSNPPGRPLLYADAAIECALLIREVYHLPLRQTQGFILSLFSWSILLSDLCNKAPRTGLEILYLF